MKPVKKLVLLHDLCSVGKAALTNMLPVLSVMGIEPCPIPTILLSTHTGGYGKPAIMKVNADYIKACARHYLEQNVTFDAIFIGYLGSTEAVGAVEAFLDAFPNLPVILDPIMGDYGRYYSNFDDNYGKAMQSLLKRADILIPNLTEACILTGTPYREEMPEDEMKDICVRLAGEAKPAASVILTSLPADETQKGIAFYRDGIFETFYYPGCKGHFHGTGDVFDGVFTAAYLNGTPIEECISAAHHFVADCIICSSETPYPEREGLMIEKSLHLLYQK